VMGGGEERGSFLFFYCIGRWFSGKGERGGEEQSGVGKTQ